ncbi:MAG TPA: trehalose-6-phosphate synthase [Acidimicrobiales bacterium]|nr:trehalose-6-phosphate synthase [Acidimicrobiales bacterium]
MTPRPDGAAPTTAEPRADLVVVANRLPVQPDAEAGVNGWRPSPGGLVSALTSVLQRGNGLWIGWPGTSQHRHVPAYYEGIRLRAVPISSDEYETFYLGFSNATLWPLYHDAIRPPAFHRTWWQSYVTVNRRYADAVAEAAAPGATVWVHDYQLQLVPRMVRERRPDVRVGFFMHIPFPPLELFNQLPWRREIVEGLLGADLVGFQTRQSAANFSRLARRLTTADGTDALVQYEGRHVRTGAFPITADVARFAAAAQDPAVRARAKEIRQDLGDPEVILLGVDRLDYTKGIQQRAKALAELYADHSLDPEHHVMVQIAVPSRESDAHYERERHELEQVVSQVNGDYGLVGRPVIHYLHQNMPFDELVALYLAADVMLVTPYRDGMNLVAKEYVTCRTDLTGRLILSEFAGAATELRGAFIVNPHDLEGVKEAIRSAVRVGPREARERMARLRRQTMRRDVYDWATTFLGALEST